MDWEGGHETERLGADRVTGLYDRCVRCGVRVPWGRSVCRQCNPANLPSPSPTQYHATVFLSVLLTLAVVAVVLVIRG